MPAKRKKYISLIGSTTLVLSSDENLERMKSSALSNYLADRILSTFELYDALLVPGTSCGGGIVHNGRYMQEAMLHRGWYPGDKLSIPNEYQQSICVGPVFYLGNLNPCWGHCLTDGLKFLWPLLPGCKRNFNLKGLKFVYTTTAKNEVLPRNLLEIFRLLGINDSNLIQVVEPTVFNNVIFADESFWLDPETGRRHYSCEYRNTIDYIQRQFVPAPVKPFRRLYFSRGKWKSGKPDFGEEQIALASQHSGRFECVSPENLSLKETVRLLSECSELMTTEGSCAHNALFLQDKTKLTIIRKADYVNGYQFPINQMRNLVVTYIDAHASHYHEVPGEPWRGPFFIYVNELLAEYLQIESHFPVGIYLRYLLFCLRKRCRHALSPLKHRYFDSLLRK